MTFISKFVVISLISVFLGTSLAQYPPIDFCGIPDGFTVELAAKVGDYLFMVINYYDFKDDEHFKYEFVRTAFFDPKRPGEYPKFKAERANISGANDWEPFLPHDPRLTHMLELQYMFSFDFKDMNEYTIFLYLSNRTGETIRMGLKKESTLRSGGDKTFVQTLNSRMIYNGHEDYSGFLNLKLLHYFIPYGVEILDIIVLVGDEDQKMFIALVYTSERISIEEYIYQRHAFKANVFQTRVSDQTAETVTRLNWTNDWAKDYVHCQQLDNKIVSAAATSVWTESGNFLANFLEFYYYVHFKMALQVDQKINSDGVKEFSYSVVQIVNDPTYNVKNPDNNRAILNCETEALKLNMTALEKLPFEGKPYDPNRCRTGASEVKVVGSALYDNKYLILDATVLYEESKPQSPMAVEAILMVRYIDTELNTKFYETHVMTTKDGPNKDGTVFDKVFRDEKWEKDLDFRGMFDFTPDQNEMTFVEGVDGTRAKQIRSELIYLNKYNKDDKSTDTKAVEIHYDPSDEKDSLNFFIYNHKIVYNHKRQTEDKSGYLNLKLFSMHFPDDVRIDAIVIFRRQTNDKLIPLIYTAFVYTTEESDGKTLHVRHYLKGTPTHFESVDYSYWRLSWEFDTNFNSCRHMGGDLTAASKLAEYKTKKGVTYKVIEFFLNFHRIIKVHFSSSEPTIDIIDDENMDGLIANKILYNCNSRPEHLYDNKSLADCLANPKFNKDYKRDQDLLDKILRIKHILDEEEVSPLFWQLLIGLAVIIAIIGLIVFGFYLRGVERKMYDQDYD